jgi:GNAT superfamily N-acetyltransferase
MTPAADVNSSPDASSGSRAAAYVARVTPDVDDSLADFFRTVWDANATGSEVGAARAAAAADNPVAPGTEIPEFVFLLNQKVIGYLGTVPVSFWNGEVETATYWLKGFMVHPEHRNGPVGFNLLKEALKVIGPSGAVAAAPAARRLFTAMGFVECGAIPNYVSVLKHGRFLSRIDVGTLGSSLPAPIVRAVVAAQKIGAMNVFGMLTGLMQGAWQGVNGVSRTGYRLQIDGTLPGMEDLNGLWTEVRGGIRAAAVRDGVFLSWRYNPAPGSLYEAANVRDSAGRLVAVAIVRKPAASGDERLRGVKLAVLADILFASDDPAAGVMALKGAEKIASRMGADAILCSATSPVVRRGLRNRAYVAVPANVFLLTRDPRGALQLPTSVDDWWLTRGDDRADDAF